MKTILQILGFLFLVSSTQAQLLVEKSKFSKDDTLRGSLNKNRTWWDVTHYAIEVNPDFASKTISSKVTIQFNSSVNNQKNLKMQIDLQQPLIIDSIFLLQNNTYTNIQFQRKNNIALLEMSSISFQENHNSILIYYHGKPKEAIRPPWDGGWIWKKDANGNPWMSVACQGLGASVWYPCKDHQSDEPDNGAILSIYCPDSLLAVGNGKLIEESYNKILNKKKYTWQVKNPINNYNIIPYIGKYEHFSDTLQGENGILPLEYYVLNYNLEKAKKQFTQVKFMMHCFEHWFGPYPFYDDTYKLVESPHLGMEHQSAVAYGNGYQNGYLGRDLSGTGWGNKWDFIIIHESGHEWFANNITSKDIADMWIHEGFTNYSETLYTEWLFGKDAGNEYNYGLRRGIRNNSPIIGTYGVNNEGSGDMYNKGGNLLQTIRHIINNDEKFRNILRLLNKKYYHQTVTTQQIENDFITQTKGLINSSIFDQYLRNIEIPELEYYYSNNKKYVFVQWNNCISKFSMPLNLFNNKTKTILKPIKNKWTKLKLSSEVFFDPEFIKNNYYITLREVNTKN